MAKNLEQTHFALNHPIGEVRQHTGEPSPEVKALPWYKYVPKDHVQQLRWRLYVRERCAKDLKFRQAILQACAEDILFFANTLCWIYEPRRLKRKFIPLNTFMDQDDHICIAHDTLVVTDRGLVPIQGVSVMHRVWDGVQFVEHSGLVFNGHRDTIHVFGVRMTPEHKVLTKDGWKEAKTAREGFSREEVRLPSGYEWLHVRQRQQGLQEAVGASEVRLRKCGEYPRGFNTNVSVSRAGYVLRKVLQAAKAISHAWSHNGWNAHSRLAGMGCDEGEVYAAGVGQLEELRNARNTSVQSMDGVRELFGGYGEYISRGAKYRQNRQQWSLLPGKLPLDNSYGAVKEQASDCLGGYGSWKDDAFRGGKGSKHTPYVDGRENLSEMAEGRPATSSQIRPVYDIVNCGPRLRFTVIGDDGLPLLVHNCWLDGCFGVRSSGVEKSRDLGLSWDCLFVLFKHWLFDKSTPMGIASLNEEKADSPDDSDSLMWKALTLDTPVLTPAGWVRNGDLSVNDVVMGSNGYPTAITAIHDHGIKDVYRVLFSDGTSVRCCGDHLWSVTTPKDRLFNKRNGGNRTEVISTKEMLRSLRTSSPRGSTVHTYHVPLCDPIVYSHRQPSYLSPYIMGTLLGDGCLTKCTTELCGIDDEIKQRVSNELPDGCRISYRNNSPCTVGIIGDPKKLQAELVRLGLRGKRAWEKFIPIEYKYGTVKARLDILRGLMDTDGWVCLQSGKRCERSDVFFETTSERLVDDVAEIVRSLGGIAYGKRSHTRAFVHNGEKRTGRTAYRIGIVLGVNPFHLKRKADKWRRRVLPQKAIVDIQLDGQEEVRCISVDAKDHLYVVNGFTLTHNCDFLFENLPEWMRVDDRGQSILKRTFNDHRFYNRVTKSVILGYACTGNLGRGGRKMAWLMDEFSEWPNAEQQRALDATQYTTHCRFFPSTFSCDSDRFFDMMRREKSTMLKIIADWKDNHEKKRGMYTAIGGRLKVIDKDYQFPNDYPFILDGKIRSPYYDAKCKDVGATPQSIARELDRDPQGATSKVFSASVLQKARETCRDAYYRGNLDFTPGEFTPIWVPDPNGHMFIWKDVDETCLRMDGGTGKLGWGGPYALGCDIGTGAGSSTTSNSSIEVIDIASGEEVLQYYWHMIRPVDFAQLAYTLCKWLCVDHDLSWAYLNWENQGPGEAFTKEIVRLGWPNCYMTRQESSVYRTRTERLGYFNADGGYSGLCEVQRGIQQDELTIRSEMTVMEFGQYEIGRAGDRSGKCIHVGSAASNDPASQGKAHGDCAIAMTMAWMAAKDRPVEKEAIVVENTDEQYLDQFLESIQKRASRNPLSVSSENESLRHAI